MLKNSLQTQITINKFTGESSDGLENKIKIRLNFLNKININTFNRKILLLPGLQYKRCINELAIRNLINRKSTEVIVIERDRKIFEDIFNMASTCAFYNKNKVLLLNCDIKEVKFNMAQLQDIDLMCTWKKAFNILCERLKNQMESVPKILPKYFMFTLSERRGGSLDFSYKKLCELLDVLSCNLTGFDNTENGFGEGFKPSYFNLKKRQYVKRYDPVFKEKGRVTSLDLYRYKDTAKMTTCLIVYE